MYMSVLILNREQVKQVISMKEVIQEVREVYRLKSQGKSVIWPLVNYEFVDEHAAMDIRSGYIKGVQLHGLKMLNNFPENREKGLPPFNGIMMVYDSNTGIPVSVMDDSYVTCMRTAAACPSSFFPRGLPVPAGCPFFPPPRTPPPHQSRMESPVPHPYRWISPDRVPS